MDKDYARKYIGKDITVTVDRPMGSKHPKHGFIYPVNYGYIPNTKAPDNCELDAFIIGLFKPVKEFRGKCIAVIHRNDDNEEKLVVVPKEKTYNDDEIMAILEFQESFFDSKVVRE